MQIIKKYANRKLYHTNRKQYITLEGIAHLIQSGQQVQVIDNETGSDITAHILTQVVSQVRGRGGSILPVTVLTSLIRFGGDTLTSLRHTFLSALGGQDIVELEIAQRISQLVHEGTIDSDEATRMRQLLVRSDTTGLNHYSLAASREIPTRHDVVRLHRQVDALVEELEKLIERQGHNTEQ